MPAAFDPAHALDALSQARDAGAPPRDVVRACLDIARWDLLPPALQAEAAGAVARATGFAFTGLEAHASGDQSHTVALFERDGRSFALLPGGVVRLGWSPRRKLGVTEAQRRVWQEGRIELNYPDEALEGFLQGQLSRPRRVSFRPFLCEVAPQPAEKYSPRLSHREIVRALAADGFRMITSNQWEYACSAGSRALFRWGEAWPEGTSYRHEATFDGHRKPNAFGLAFLDDSYKAELCREHGVARGGDGGCIVCGGLPELETWVTFASAYLYGGHKKGEDVSILREEGTAFVRRVRPV